MINPRLSQLFLAFFLLFATATAAPNTTEIVDAAGDGNGDMLTKSHDLALVSDGAVYIVDNTSDKTFPTLPLPTTTTYTFNGSGGSAGDPWTDEDLWSPSYPGTTIGELDEAIINTNCDIDAAVTIEGRLTVNARIRRESGVSQLTVADGAALTINTNGSLSGLNVFFEDGATMNNSGVIRLASVGSWSGNLDVGSGTMATALNAVQVTGNYSGTGTFEVQHDCDNDCNNGTTAPRVGSLTLGGTANLDGVFTFEVRDNPPAIGDEFVILSASSIAGTFSNSFVDLGGGLYAVAHYSATQVTLKIDDEATFTFTGGNVSNDQLWTDPNNWSPSYPGTTIGSQETVIINSECRINDDVTINGTCIINGRIFGSTQNDLLTFGAGSTLDIREDGVLAMRAIAFSGNIALLNAGEIQFVLMPEWGTDLPVGAGTLQVNGPSIGTTVSGNYSGTGILEIVHSCIDASNNSCTDVILGRLAITGSAMLGGELAFSVDGISPFLGESYVVLEADGGITGAFENTFVDLDNGLFANIYYNDSNARSMIDQVEIRIESQALLPVDLLSFRAQAQEKQVQLHWQTAQEWNNAGFLVQRSPVGKDWEDIGFVAGAGDTSQPQAYTFLDQEPWPGRSYYRLAQTDLDGTVTYSKVEAVVVGQQAVLELYPNPVQDQIFVSTTTVGDYHIIGGTGRIYANGQLTDTQGEIDLTGLPAGVYILQFTTTADTVVRQFVKH